MSTPENSPLAAVILAAGKGTRMKSRLAKVLHPVLGRPLLIRLLETLRTLHVQPQVVVVGYQGEEVQEVCRQFDPHITFAQQTEQRGSGHAAQMALPVLEGFSGRVLILSGDMPLLDAQLLSQLVETSQRGDEDLTLLSANSPQHRDFGRIVRDAQGRVERIQEAKDCSPQEYALTEVNLGAYCAKAQFLRQFLPRLEANNAQGEFYITDLVALARQNGLRVGALVTDKIECALGVNSRLDLATVSATLKERYLERLMLQGVSILDPTSTWIEDSVQIGPDCVIWPGTVLCGQTTIASGCQIGPNTQITDSQVGPDCQIAHSVLLQAQVEEGVKIGPFAYLRPGAKIGPQAKVGDFVEIKNSTIGRGAKVPHLSYIGDSSVGAGTNIGCGTITCNYDGRAKHRTIIGEKVFIGSNSSLVAPVQIGDGATTGAGAVVTRDVPPHSVVVGVPARPLPPKN